MKWYEENISFVYYLIILKNKILCNHHFKKKKDMMRKFSHFRERECKKKTKNGGQFCLFDIYYSQLILLTK
jgi:hypothetical protein